jgi:hypothetical protein
MKRAFSQPAHLAPPRYLSPSPPVPNPEQLGAVAAPAGEEDRPEPTRFGDWERKGIAVDF